MKEKVTHRGFSPFILRMVIVLTVGMVMIFFTYKFYRSTRKLPFYNPVDLDTNLVDASVRNVRKYHKVRSFSLVNQYGETVSYDTFSGKIYVADFFFVSCPGICIPMAKNMKIVQDHFLEDDRVKMLSHTVNPEEDSVSVLKTYAAKKGAIKGKWHVVTGAKRDIYRLARKTYFAVKSKGDGGSDDFIHTENFILVDPNGHLRGFYDGTQTEEINRLLEDIEVLKNEFSI